MPNVAKGHRRMKPATHNALHDTLKQNGKPPSLMRQQKATKTTRTNTSDAKNGDINNSDTNNGDTNNYEANSGKANR